MSEAIWKIIDGNGAEMGPYSQDDLQGFYQAGIISGETLVWTAGWDQWFPAAQVDGLLPINPAEATAPQPSARQIDLAAQLGLEPVASGSPPKASIPLWLSIVTVVIGACGLVLFFFPWVSTMSSEGFGAQKKIMENHSQTGIQSLSPSLTFNDELLKQMENLGMTDEMKQEVRGAGENGKLGLELEPIAKATLVLIALIVVGLGVLLSLVSVANQIPSLAAFAQVCYAVGAILIGVQMGQQFPMVKTFVNQMNSGVDQEIAAIAEADATSKGTGEPTPEALKDLRQGAEVSFYGKFQPACFAAIGILGSSILFIVVTMTMMNNSTISIPSPSAGTAEQRPPGGFRLQ